MEEEKMEIEEIQPSFLKRFWFIPLILVILAILGVGIFWVYKQKLAVPKVIPTPAPTTIPTPVVEVDTTTAALEQQGTSDEISAIEADLEATDFTEIDKELEDIEAELTD